MAENVMTSSDPDWTPLFQEVLAAKGVLYPVVYQYNFDSFPDDVNIIFQNVFNFLDDSLSHAFGRSVQMAIPELGLSKIPLDSEWRALAEWALKEPASPAFSDFLKDARSLLQEVVSRRERLPSEWARSFFVSERFVNLPGIVWFLWTLSLGHSVVVEVGPAGQVVEQGCHVWTVDPNRASR